MKSLIDVASELGTERQCLEYLEAKRWPGGVACLKCGSMKVSRTELEKKARREKKDGTKKGDVIGLGFLYDCLEGQCGHQFTATTGTIFHDSHLPLAKWFLAVAILVNAKKSASSLQIQRDLGLGSYKTAWHLTHRIRKAMDQDSGIFSGTVEADETYVGGKYDKRRKRGPWQKAAVFGMLQRGQDGKPSTVRSFPVANTGKALIVGAIRDNVSTDAAMICTDERTVHKSLDSDYNRQVVNHIKKEYAKKVDGEVVTTNGIENFWSLFKRRLWGSTTASA